VKNERKQCPSWEDMDHLHGKRYVFVAVAGKWGATILQRLNVLVNRSKGAMRSQKRLNLPIFRKHGPSCREVRYMQKR
jgi:hypothetical protein